MCTLWNDYHNKTDVSIMSNSYLVCVCVCASMWVCGLRTFKAYSLSKFQVYNMELLLFFNYYLFIYLFGCVGS